MKEGIGFAKPTTLAREYLDVKIILTEPNALIDYLKGLSL